MHHRHGEKCVEACRETLPADDQAAVLALEPRKRPLGLEARNILFNGSPTSLSVFPDAFRDLGANTSFAQFIGVCRRSKWSKHVTNSPFLARLAMVGSNAGTVKLTNSEVITGIQRVSRHQLFSYAAASVAVISRQMCHLRAISWR
jgi:hypothetical protein